MKNFSCEMICTALLLTSVACSGGGKKAASMPTGQACTAMGCGPAVNIAFSKASAWRGRYAIHVLGEGDSALATCRASFPLSCDAHEPCEGTQQVLLLQSGCALPAEAQSLSGLQIPDASAPGPRTLKIIVFEGETKISERVVHPAYKKSYPNGPQCGFACYAAPSETLKLE